MLLLLVVAIILIVPYAALSLFVVHKARRFRLAKAAAVVMVLLPFFVLPQPFGGNDDDRGGESTPSFSEQTTDPEPSTSLAEQYRNQVAREIESQYPEAQQARCKPSGEDILVCSIRIGPTPANPGGGRLNIQARVEPGGSWDLVTN